MILYMALLDYVAFSYFYELLIMARLGFLLNFGLSLVPSNDYDVAGSKVLVYSSPKMT